MTTLIFTKEKIDSLNEKDPGSILIVLNEQATKSKKEPGMLVSLYREGGRLRPFSIGVDDEEKSWPGVIGVDKKYAPIKDGQHVAFKNNDGEYEIFKFKKIKDEKGTGFFFVELTGKGLEAKATDGKGDKYIAYSDSKPAFDPKTAAFVEATPLFKTITGKAPEVETPAPVAPAEVPSALAGLQGGAAARMPKVKEGSAKFLGFLKKLKDMAMGAVPFVLETGKNVLLAPVKGFGAILDSGQQLNKENPVEYETKKEQDKADGKRQAGLIGRLILGAGNLISGGMLWAKGAIATLSLVSPAQPPTPKVEISSTGVPTVKTKTPASDGVPLSGLLGVVAAGIAAQTALERRDRSQAKDGTGQKGRG